MNTTLLPQPTRTIIGMDLCAGDRGTTALVRLQPDGTVRTHERKGLPTAHDAHELLWDWHEDAVHPVIVLEAAYLGRNPSVYGMLCAAVERWATVAHLVGYAVAEKNATSLRATPKKGGSASFHRLLNHFGMRRPKQGRAAWDARLRELAQAALGPEATEHTGNALLAALWGADRLGGRATVVDREPALAALDAAEQSAASRRTTEDPSSPLAGLEGCEMTRALCGGA